MSRLVIKVPAREQLAALPRPFQEALDEALLRLQEDAGAGGTWLGPPYDGRRWLEVRGYLIVFKVLDAEDVVVVEAIRHRRPRQADGGPVAP